MARISKDFAVADIENRRNGKVLAISTYAGEGYRDCRSWEEWVDLMGGLVHDPRYRTVYAHNGGGWDWLSLLQWIIESGRWEELITEPPIMSGDDLIALRLCIGGKVVMLADSLLLLKKGLDACGRKFLGEGKVALDKLPEWYWEHDRKLFWEYLHGDCGLLYRVLCKFADIVHTISHVGRMGITLPSLALRIFRTSFLDRTIYTPSQRNVKESLREAYRGGRVDVFRPGHYKRVNVYDVNSMYPAVMKTTPVPTGSRVTYTLEREFDGCGCFRVRFNQKDRSKPPLLLVESEGAYEGEGWYFTPELRRFRGRIEVLDGFVFDDTAIIFAGYVDTMYSLRMTDREGPLGDITKHLLTDLYGKYGQKPERTTIVQADGEELDDLIDQGLEPTELSEEHGLYRITEPCEVPHEHVGIAGIITSEARGRLWEYMDSRTIYCDTDSVHTTGTLPTDPTKLGALKREYQGEAVYVGRKCYALRGVGLESKVRIKGVRLNKPKDKEKLGCDLDFDSLLKVLHGGKVVGEFRSAPTFNNVIRGGAACTFDPAANRSVARRRTIRRTA